jgi:hypothetical protein
MGIKTGIYYFTWYNEQRWREAPVKHTPLLGQYDSSDPAIVWWQLDLIRYCGLDYVVFELIPEDDWGFATVERGIDTAIAYLRGHAMQWSFLLDAKRGPSNGVVEGRSAMEAIERMYLYLLKRRWTDGLVRGPSGKPLLFVFAPVCEDALRIEDELGIEAEFRMPIFHPDHRWDEVVDVTKIIPGRYLEKAQRRLGGGDVGPMSVFEILVAQGYVSFWGETVRDCAGFSSVIPGYDDSLLERVPQVAPKVCRREGETLRQQFLAASRNRPAHIIIYGWNEYFEGTCIEPSKQWGMEYVELLRSLIGGLRDSQAGTAERQ